MGITAGDINNIEYMQNNSSKKPNCNGNNVSNNCSNSSNNSLQNNSNINNDNKEFNGLLKDLIKILTIKELTNRNNIRRFPFTYGNNMQLPPYYTNYPYMIN